jgi:hypothetical protein
LIFEFFDIFGELLIAFGGGVIVINIFIWFIFKIDYLLVIRFLFIFKIDNLLIHRFIFLDNGIIIFLIDINNGI